MGGTRPAACAQCRSGARIAAARSGGRERDRARGRRIRAARPGRGARRRSLRGTRSCRSRGARARRSGRGRRDATPGSGAVARPGACGRRHGALRPTGDRAARRSTAQLHERPARRRPRVWASPRSRGRARRARRRSTRSTSDFGASTCSPSIAPAGRWTPSPLTATPAGRSSRASASSRRRTCARWRQRSCATMFRSPHRRHLPGARRPLGRTPGAGSHVWSRSSARCRPWTPSPCAPWSSRSMPVPARWPSGTKAPSSRCTATSS